MATGSIPLLSLSVLLICSPLAKDKLQAANQPATTIDAVTQPSSAEREKREKELRTTPSPQSHQAIYSLVLRNKTPKLNPGETVQVEIYLSGYGIPARNKLHIQWSSDDVVDNNQPGVIQAWLGSRIHEATKRKIPFKLVKPEEARIVLEGRPHSGGLTIHLGSGTFLRPVQVLEPKNDEFERVACELMWDGKPPLLLNLKTSSDAPSGDYEIAFTFTYADGQGLFQDRRTVQFHIRDWQERNTWIVPSAFIIAFLSLLVTAIGTVYQILGAANKPFHRIAEKSGSR
jgi:hypothetical protein